MNQIVEAINESKGRAGSITEKQMIDAQTFLSRKGLYCEYTSAVTLAGLNKLVGIGEVNSGQTVLLALTGTGLKEK